MLIPHLVAEVPGLPSSVENQELSRSWGVLPEDPWVHLRRFGWATEEVGSIMWLLSEVGTGVVIFFWVYSVQKRL